MVAIAEKPTNTPLSVRLQARVTECASLISDEVVAGYFLDFGGRHISAIQRYERTDLRNDAADHATPGRAKKLFEELERPDLTKLHALILSCADIDINGAQASLTRLLRRGEAGDEGEYRKYDELTKEGEAIKEKGQLQPEIASFIDKATSSFKRHRDSTITAIRLEERKIYDEAIAKAEEVKRRINTSTS